MSKLCKNQSSTDSPYKKLSWVTKSFNELNTTELFEILKLRQAVFVVEQECPYPDVDDTDLVSMHLSGYNDDKELLAYARLIKQNVSYREASIGRVVVSPDARGNKLGEQLMLQALAEMERLFPDQPIKIGAQQQLETFYNKLGFKTISDMYMEDGIAHIHMLRDA